MKLVVQRVSRAEVQVEGRRVGEIGKGFLVLVGAERETTRPGRRRPPGVWPDCASSRTRRER